MSASRQPIGYRNRTSKSTPTTNTIQVTTNHSSWRYRYRYCPKEGAMAVTCCGKKLDVLNTRINDQGEQECEVKASG